MSNSEYKEIEFIKDLDFGFFTFKKGARVQMCNPGLKTFFKSEDGLEISIANEVMDEKLKKETYFVSVEEMEDCVTYGTVLNLLTPNGVESFSVESIEFRNAAYVNLSLKTV